MHFSKIHTAQVLGLTAHIIDVEADLSRGLHAFSLVGLPSASVDESRDRVSAAVKNSGFASPKQKNQKIVISLAPADLKKEGSHYDLAIALAYLTAEGEMTFDTSKKVFLGELSLDGTLRPIRGALLLAQAAQRAGFEELFVPAENAREAAFVEGIKVYGAHTLTDVVRHFSGGKGTALPLCAQEECVPATDDDTTYDISHIKGQEFAKRALAISAAGKHNLALWGPPGTGKTMLAETFSRLLPDLDGDEMLEVTGIHSVAGILRNEVVTRPPLRAPHHTASYPSVIGGGTVPKPGDVTLAHRGVLFLDEFPEFDRRVIESLREPLEEGRIRIARSKGYENFPARFILLAAMNPCPCGKYGSEEPCVCMPGVLAAYQRKLSGPIIDRIDLWVKVSKMSHDKLSEEKKGEGSASIRARVIAARECQKARFIGHPRRIMTNNEMRADDVEKLIILPQNLRALFNSSAERLKLSPRAYHKMLKVARTIADLEGSTDIKEAHLLEALSYRPTELR